MTIKDDRGYNQKFLPSQALEIRTERRCDYMISQMELKVNTRILEIGCGTGEISYMLAKKTGSYVLGTDLCVPFIEKANKEYAAPNLKYLVVDFNNPGDIAHEKFDYIVGNGILHHLYYNLEEALKSINKLLTDNGKIIFLEPNILNPYCFLIFKFPYFRKLASLEPTEMAFTKSYIENILLKTRYNEIKVEYMDFLLPVVPDFLVKSSIRIGSIVEKISLLNRTSQSIYISAKKV
jgi:2-polyprenyl-3-methyl-5-hydroxy-6-metoxy-1,4-benzoquinol methylase